MTNENLGIPTGKVRQMQQKLFGSEVETTRKSTGALGGKTVTSNPQTPVPKDTSSKLLRESTELAMTGSRVGLIVEHPMGTAASTEEKVEKLEMNIRVSKEMPPSVKDTADDTQYLASNSLENFVGFFSKSEKEKMRKKRLDGMATKLQKHIGKGKNEKAVRALVNLANVSPSKLEKAIKNIDIIGPLPKDLSEKKTRVIVQTLTSAMTKVPPNQFPCANRLLSFALGQTVLQPKETKDSNSKEIILANSFIKKKGIDKPVGCGEDLWRSINRTKVFREGSNDPILDGTSIKKGKQGDKERNQMMRKTLNLFYQHVTSTEDELIPLEDQGASQKEASNLGKGLKNRLSSITKNQQKTMQLLFGLGAQELSTRPINFSIPDNYITLGKDPLLIQGRIKAPEFVEDMKPFEYKLSISITLLKNGGIEYRLSQPTTFRDRNSKNKDPIGACRMETTFTFNKKMKCTSMKQEVKPAKIDIKSKIAEQKD